MSLPSALAKHTNQRRYEEMLVHVRLHTEVDSRHSADEFEAESSIRFKIATDRDDPSNSRNDLERV